MKQVLFGKSCTMFNEEINKKHRLLIRPSVFVGLMMEDEAGRSVGSKATGLHLVVNVEIQLYRVTWSSGQSLSSR